MQIIKEDLELYKEQVNAGSSLPLPYERLMIYYRKQKQYDKELQVLKKGIGTLRKFFAEIQNEDLKKKINPRIRALSKKIGQSTGLIDKKGKEVYLPEPLPRWLKRQSVVEQKIAKQNAENKNRRVK